MKKILKVGSLFAAGILVLFIAGSLLFPLIATKFVRMEASYAEYPVETMMGEADLIFQGQVVSIGNTRWNQDNGRYWSDGLPYHIVTLSVIEPIVGEFVGDEEVELIVIGNSPLDSRQDTILESENNLHSGDKIVVFARDTEFAWRQPERIPAIMFMGSPQTSVFIEAEDGLYHSIDGDAYSVDGLIEEIQEERLQR